MTNGERVMRMYASFSNDELIGRIAHEEKLKRGGYYPDELDLKKCGFNPATCELIIEEIRGELDRRYGR